MQSWWGADIAKAQWFVAAEGMPKASNILILQ
jgi:hypothetical protein